MKKRVEITGSHGSQLIDVLNTQSGLTGLMSVPLLVLPQ